MNPIPPDVLQELQREYVATFSEKEKAIENAFGSRNWKDLLNQFHKLAGSGATYSMPEITELCRRVEVYLIQNDEPSETVLSECIAVLKKIFDGRKTGRPYPLMEDPILKKFSFS